MGKVNTKEDKRLWTRITSPEKLCRFHRGGFCSRLYGRMGRSLTWYPLFCKGMCPEFEEKEDKCLEG